MLIKVELGCGLTLEEIENLREVLRKAAWEALGGHPGKIEGLLKLLLEDKNIIEATQAYHEVGLSEGRKAAKMDRAWYNLLMVLGGSR